MEIYKTYTMGDSEISKQYKKALTYSVKSSSRDAEISFEQKRKYREPIVYRRHPLAKAVRKTILEQMYEKF